MLSGAPITNARQTRGRRYSSKRAVIA
jgi:hypothetical protein